MTEGGIVSRALLVLGAGLLTAMATGLGALPFAFFRDIGPRLLAAANAIASGLMLGACFSLIREGSRYGTTQTLLGGGIGVLLIIAGQRALQGREVAIGRLRGAAAKQVLLLVGVMTLHSFSEGVAVGVSFAGGDLLAAMITLAIAVHNIPEGLAISAVMRPRGASLLACAGWSVFSSLPQPLMAVPAYVFVETFSPLLPYGLGLAAGAMVFLVFVELLPEAFTLDNRARVGLWTSLTLVGMILLQRYLG
jgi:zinc transporter ZupT